MENNPNDDPGTTGKTDSSSLITEQVKQGAHQAVQQTQQVAGQVADQARGQSQTMFDSRKGQAAETLKTVAQAFRQTGESLRTQEQGPIAGVTDSVASRIDGVASYLEERDLGQFVSEAESYTRRSPAIVLGGAFLLGLAAARFLKSSAPKAGDSRGQSGFGGYGNYSGYRSYGNHGSKGDFNEPSNFGSAYGSSYGSEYSTIGSETSPLYGGVSDAYPSGSVGSRTRSTSSTGHFSTGASDLTDSYPETEITDGTSNRSR